MVNTENILVSVICDVYNHEPYLRDCLEGFVMQQTNFQYEILIHDDASTDNSVKIIQEYVDKYPHLFKPIYQTVNQYSQGVGIWRDIQMPRANGKYIAICEGDDYWTDPWKLQKQVDFMEANPDYSICFHKVKTLIQSTGELKDEFIVRDMPGTSTIVDLAIGNYIHTPSVLYRKSNLDQSVYQNMTPCLPGDYVMWMLLAEKGNIYKIEEFMAVYRYGVGIWSDKASVTNSLESLKTLAKLSCVIKNPEAKKILVDEVKLYSVQTIKFIEEHSPIRNSYAYRLGKLLLKPFSWLRRVFGKK
jgi:glycosyltransferase involved in cell wall biosynthesis